MKAVLLFVFSLLAIVCKAQSEAQGTKSIDALEKKTMDQKKAILRIEQVDTTEGGGRRLTVTRTYFLDEARKNLLLITAYENQQSPNKGLQVVYTFSNNTLVKVSARPANSVCRRCMAAYYFSNDSLIDKREESFSVPNALSLIDDAKRLAARVLPLMNAPQ
jgi:hypothetical protein